MATKTTITAASVAGRVHDVESSPLRAMHWEASGDQGSYVEYWIGGAYKFYVADLEGNIAVRMSDLKAHPEMTIAEFIARMDIPEFPLFEIVESSTPQPA